MRRIGPRGDHHARGVAAGYAARRGGGGHQARTLPRHLQRRTGRVRQERPRDAPRRRPELAERLPRLRRPARAWRIALCGTELHARQARLRQNPVRLLRRQHHAAQLRRRICGLHQVLHRRDGRSLRAGGRAQLALRGVERTQPLVLLDRRQAALFRHVQGSRGRDQVGRPADQGRRPRHLQDRVDRRFRRVVRGQQRAGRLLRHPCLRR